LPKETTVAESPDWASNLEPYDYKADALATLYNPSNPASFFFFFFIIYLFIYFFIVIYSYITNLPLLVSVVSESSVHCTGTLALQRNPIAAYYNTNIQATFILTYTPSVGYIILMSTCDKTRVLMARL